MAYNIFTYHSIKTIKRTDIKSHESRVFSFEPSIDINPNLFYISLGLENPTPPNKYLDERIYHPKVIYIKKEIIHGVEMTKEEISLDVERCQVQIFGYNCQNQLSLGELNNSYCLKDFYLALVCEEKYNQSLYIQITMHPCVNKTKKK